MAFNTGNPIGSTDARDLSDNAQDFDEAINGTGDTWTDRLGVSRRTLRGGIGYTGTGTDGAIESYASGLVLSGYNVIILYSGEFYRPSASATLPYTTTATLPDVDSNLASIGDANLRQDLSSNAFGSGAALVSMEGGPSVEVAVLDRVIRVISISAIRALNSSVDEQVSLSGISGGTFYFSNADLSTEVSADPDSGYYVAPSTDLTGASGAWIRSTGIFHNTDFPSEAPNKALFFSGSDSRLYIFLSGSWELIDETLDQIITDHIITDDAHGLREQTVQIGEGAIGELTRPVAIGYNTYSGSGCVVIGREASSSENSPFSVIVGAQSKILNSTDLRNNQLIGNSITLMESQNTTAIGKLTLVENTANGIALNGSAASSNKTLINTIKCIAIGAGARVYGTVGGEIEASIAFGDKAESTYSRSSAIGHDSITTAEDQVMLGSSTDAVEVPGSFNVTGTKSFKIPHPVPNKKDTHTLSHGSYEGPVSGGTLYRYSVTAVSGTATLELPDYFKYLNKDVDILVNPTNHFGRAFGKIVDNTLTVSSDSDGEYTVIIFGTRKDDSVQNYKGAEVENGNS